MVLPAVMGDDDNADEPRGNKNPKNIVIAGPFRNATEIKGWIRTLKGPNRPVQIV